MRKDVKEKIKAMIDGADTKMEKEFWEDAYRLLEKIEHLDEQQALKVERDGHTLYLWKGEDAVQFVNTQEGKAGSKELSEAVVLAVLFIRDGDSTIAIVPKSEALQAKMKLMMEG